MGIHCIMSFWLGLMQNFENHGDNCTRLNAINWLKWQLFCYIYITTIKIKITFSAGCGSTHL
jgi:hypothetical protein